MMKIREIERSTRFKRDYKRALKGKSKAYCTHLEQELRSVIAAFAAEQPLADKYQDHILRGGWQGYRDCHIFSDMVLIYALPNADTLSLARLGSHAALCL